MTLSISETWGDSCLGSVASCFLPGLSCILLHDACCSHLCFNPHCLLLLQLYSYYFNLTILMKGSWYHAIDKGWVGKIKIRKGLSKGRAFVKSRLKYILFLRYKELCTFSFSSFASSRFPTFIFSPLPLPWFWQCEPLLPSMLSQ